MTSLWQAALAHGPAGATEDCVPEDFFIHLVRGMLVVRVWQMQRPGLIQCPALCPAPLVVLVRVHVHGALPQVLLVDMPDVYLLIAVRPFSLHSPTLLCKRPHSTLQS